MKTSVLISLILTCGLLGGMVAENMQRPKPADAEPYHQTVRIAVQNIPYKIGDWVGHDTELQRAAIQLLKPNVTLSRIYKNTKTGQSFSFLLIHCKDTSDLQGHYPPNCYANSGWTPHGGQETKWSMEKGSIEGMIYKFEKKAKMQLARLRVANLLILPDGSIGHSMDEVYELAADYTMRHFGAAEIQFVFQENRNFSKEDRHKAVTLFLKEIESVLDLIRSGVKKNE